MLMTFKLPINPDSHIPAISIGLPVFNGGAKLRLVLESLVQQTFTDFELIISDNCSTDQTEQICRSFAQQDSRLRYLRQNANQGADSNFRVVLAEARAPFFVWAAADDLRSLDFVSVNLNFLLAHPDYVASVSPVRFVAGDFNAVTMGDAALDHELPEDRILAFLQRRHANGRFYAIYRTEIVRSWRHLADCHFLGADWTFVAHAAARGKINRAADGWLELGREGMSHTADIFTLLRGQALDWMAPLRRTSVEIYRLIAHASWRHRLALIRRLVGVNIWAFLAQFKVLYLRRKRAS